MLQAASVASSATRFWTLPSLAARMTPPGGALQVRRSECLAVEAPERQESLEVGACPSPLREQFDEDRLDRIMSHLDAAMAGSDGPAHHPRGR